MSGGLVCRYTLDAAERVVAVDEAWVRFGRENGWEDPLAALGRSLWEFVAGLEVQQLMREVFARARERGALRGLCFRCDSPDRLRRFDMDLRTLEDGALEVASRLVEETPRPPIPLLVPGVAAEAAPPLAMCSWCKAVRGDRGWVPLEQAAQEPGLYDAHGRLPPLTHGICERCHAEVRATIGSPGREPRPRRPR